MLMLTYLSYSSVYVEDVEDVLDVDSYLGAIPISIPIAGPTTSLKKLPRTGQKKKPISAPRRATEDLYDVDEPALLELLDELELLIVPVISLEPDDRDRVNISDGRISNISDLRKPIYGLNKSELLVESCLQESWFKSVQLSV